MGNGLSSGTGSAELRVLPTFTTSPAEAYDRVAEEYDRGYLTPADLGEEQAVLRLLSREGYLDGRVLDIGCGTGLLLDRVPGLSGRYVGVDPSMGMLRQAQRKFPGSGCWHNMGVEGMAALMEVRRPFDSAVSLYGSFSYTPDAEAGRAAILRCLASAGRVALMVMGPEHPGSRILNGMDELKLKERLWDPLEAAEFFSAGLAGVQVRGFGSADHLLKHLDEDAADRMVTAELRIHATDFHKRCRYLLVTGRKA